MTIEPIIQRNEHDVDCCGGNNLLPIDMAIAKGLALARPIEECETIALSKARGRISFDDTIAVLPLPNFDNSAMDGYALNTASLSGIGPFSLEISGRMAAGDMDAKLNASAEMVPATGAIRILTGALVPTNYNAVIMQEKVTRNGNIITFDKSPAPGTNIRLAGEDCRSGDLIVPAGTLLEARHIAILAAQGLDKISVRRKVRVAIFSTGSELRQPGEALLSGQIYNSNRFALACQLDIPSIQIIDLGTIKDDYELLKTVTAQAAAAADIVITTGGVSVGDEDHMPGIVKDLGGQLHVMKVAIKPGKPVTVGMIDECIFLGLPGNPVAAYVNQILIGRAIIEKLNGLEPSPPTNIAAIANFDRERSSTRQEYVPAKIVATAADGRPIVEAFRKAGSATLSPLANSDGFVILPVGMGDVKNGDALQFIPH